MTTYRGSGNVIAGNLIGVDAVQVTVDDVANNFVATDVENILAELATDITNTYSANQTLTNKTINLGSNTLSGTTAQFNTALSDGDFATLAGSETITNKTIALGSNTISGTSAQFDAALSDDNFTYSSILASNTTGQGASLVGFDLTNQTVEAGATQGVDGITQLKTFAPVANRTIYLRYHTTAGDGGHGYFRALTTGGPYTDDNGITIVPTGGDGSSCWRRVYSGAVNVSWYGFSESATATANATALTSAHAASRSLYIPAGTYQVLPDNFDLRDSCNIEGAGMGATILQISGAGKLINAPGTDGDYITSPRLAFLTLDGNSVGTTGLNLDRVQRNPRFEWVEIKGFTEGIRGRRVFNGKFDNLWVHNNTKGVIADSGFNANTIDTCLIHSNTSYGICTEDTLALGFYGKVGNVITNNDFEENGVGINLGTGSAFNEIIGNYFEAHTTWGINIDGDATFDADGNIIRDNSFTGSGSRINLGQYTNFTYVDGNFANGIGGGNYLLTFNANTKKVTVRHNRNYGAGAGIVNLAGTLPLALDYDMFDGANRTVYMNTGRVIFDGAGAGNEPRFNDGAIIGQSGTTLTQIKAYAPSLTPASVAANTTAEQTFTVAGITTADKLFINKTTPQTGLGIVNVRAYAADTIGITFSNNTGGAITPTSEAYNIIAVRS